MSKTFSLCFFFALNDDENLHHHHLGFFYLVLRFTFAFSRELLSRSAFSLFVKWLFFSFFEMFFETQMNMNFCEWTHGASLLSLICRIWDEQNLWSSLWGEEKMKRVMIQFNPRRCTKAMGKLWIASRLNFLRAAWTSFSSIFILKR